MATSAAQYKASKKWADANYRRVSIAMAPADYDTIKAAAASSPDGSLNKYIINAVLERVQRESEAPIPAPIPSAEQPQQAAPAVKKTEQAARPTLADLMAIRDQKLADKLQQEQLEHPGQVRPAEQPPKR